MDHSETLKKNIVLVEDDRSLRDLYADTLEEAGYAVHAFSSPELALKGLAIDGVTFDLLLTDLRLRATLDGIELAEAVRKAGHDFPILLVSSAPPDIKPAAVDLVLRKPVSCDLLIETVARHLDPMPGVA